MPFRRRRFRSLRHLPPTLRRLTFAVFLIVCVFRSPLAQGQGNEIVASLAAGRVIIAVTKDAIVIGALEDRIEADTRPPAIVPLGSRRAAVLLGAVVWSVPSFGYDLARLDKELPRLRARFVSPAPHLQQGEAGSEATDIEQTGLGLLERLQEVVKHLHAKLDLRPNEPLVELVLADYVEDYGPEVWLLSYPIEQESLRGDYWETHALRPRYTQLWPPEKGRARSLMEVRYPSEGPSPAFLDLLRRRDPRLERIRTSDSKMERLVEWLLSGDSRKAPSSATVQFLRASLAAIAPVGAGQAFAVINERTGFDWILAPPEEPQKPSPERPSGAPSLRKPTKPEFRSWRWSHRDLLIDFEFRLRVQDATSAKLDLGSVRRFPAKGCVCASHPKPKTCLPTQAGAEPNGVRRVPAVT